jgi:hypothetical protein
MAAGSASEEDNLDCSRDTSEKRNGTRKEMRLRVGAGNPYPTLNLTGSQLLTNTRPKSCGCGFGERVRASNDRFKLM